MSPLGNAIVKASALRDANQLNVTRNSEYNIVAGFDSHRDTKMNSASKKLILLQTSEGVSNNR